MLTCQKHLFSIPDETAYLNCAYMSPNAKPVEEAGYHAVARKNLPYKITIPDFFEPVEKLRALFAKLIGSTDRERVAIIPSVSYGMATVIRNVKIQAGQNIVMVEEDFPSDYYAWKQLAEANGAEVRMVKAPAFSISTKECRGKQWNENILEAIDDKTVAAAIPHVHWADGTRFDLEAIRLKTRESDALLIVDGTQSVGALSFDLNTIQPDALICAGYKWLLGSYGLGLAWFGERFDHGKPVEESWINRIQSEDFQALVKYQDRYRPKAGRYNMGESSQFIAVPMLTAALELLMGWGIDFIQHYARQLSEPYFEKFKAMGCRMEDLPYRSSHLAGVRLPDGVNVEDLKNRLNALKVYVSFRGNALRVSTHVFNKEEDFQKLESALKEVLK